MRKYLALPVIGILVLMMSLTGCEAESEKTARQKKEMKEYLWLFGDTYGQTVGRRFFTYEELQSIDSIQKITYSTIESLEKDYKAGKKGQDEFVKEYIEVLQKGTRDINLYLDVLEKRIEETDEIELLEKTTG